MERATRQRAAIRDAVERADRPLSPREILDAAGRQVKGMGLATIYRAVKDGVEEGWLRGVELPGGPTRYEPAGKQHHHHFECRACHRVFEVDGCPGNIGRLAPPGVRLEGHEIVLYGLCETCNR